MKSPFAEEGSAAPYIVMLAVGIFILCSALVNWCTFKTTSKGSQSRAAYLLNAISFFVALLIVVLAIVQIQVALRAQECATAQASEL